MESTENPFKAVHARLRNQLTKQLQELNDPDYKEYTGKLFKDNTVFVAVPSHEGPVGFTINFPLDYPFKGPELIQTTHPSLVDVPPFEGTVLKQSVYSPSYRLCHYVIELHNIVNTILN